mgnify:CR=1 FL=1
MTWINLNDVYVNKTGGTITGDLAVNGNLTINDATGNGTIYNVANEISTLRDSVSREHIGTGMVTFCGCTIKLDCYAIPSLRLVIVSAYQWSGNISTSSSYEGISSAALTLPSNLRPDSTRYATLLPSMKYSKTIGVAITDNGSVCVWLSTYSAVNTYGFEGGSCVIGV